jgi:hypothetical protein
VPPRNRKQADAGATPLRQFNLRRASVWLDTHGRNRIWDRSNRLWEFLMWSDRPNCLPVGRHTLSGPLASPAESGGLRHYLQSAHFISDWSVFARQAPCSHRSGWEASRAIISADANSSTPTRSADDSESVRPSRRHLTSVPKKYFTLRRIKFDAWFVSIEHGPLAGGRPHGNEPAIILGWRALEVL